MSESWMGRCAAPGPVRRLRACILTHPHPHPTPGGWTTSPAGFQRLENWREKPESHSRSFGRVEICRWHTVGIFPLLRFRSGLHCTSLVQACIGAGRGRRAWAETTSRASAGASGAVRWPRGPRGPGAGSACQCLRRRHGHWQGCPSAAHFVNVWNRSPSGWRRRAVSCDVGRIAAGDIITAFLSIADRGQMWPATNRRIRRRRLGRQSASPLRRPNVPESACDAIRGRRILRMARVVSEADVEAP